MQYNAILVDLDGVIRRWQSSDESIETACNLPIGSIRKIAFEPKLLNLAITGAITDEVWRDRIARQLHE
jgi:putative hydrolase of the HAD superfamily